MPKTKTTTGKIQAVDTITLKTGGRSVMIRVDDDNFTVRSGDTVEIRRVLTDEEIGKRLREMLAQRGHVSDADHQRAIEVLANHISDDGPGWPILADLIREAAEG